MPLSRNISEATNQNNVDITKSGNKIGESINFDTVINKYKDS
jgi:hypothetical protein